MNGKGDDYSLNGNTSFVSRKSWCRSVALFMTIVEEIFDANGWWVFWNSNDWNLTL
jgi:hypothetical protein